MPAPTDQPASGSPAPTAGRTTRTDTHPTVGSPAVRGVYDVVAMSFVAFLLISNVAATKLISLDFGALHLVFDGGAILFPFTYVLGDVLSEVYGFARARRVIIAGFVMSFLASGVFWLVGQAPPAADYANQDAFLAVLGFVPRIVAASLAGYVVGQLLNAWVLTRIKATWGPDRLWVRLLGSTLVGELVDTAVFCTIAFYGVVTGAEFLNYVIVGYVYKVAVEAVLLPVTYRVIAVVRRTETTGHHPQEATA